VFIYPRWNEIDTPTLVQWAYPAGVIVIVLALVALRNRIGRGPLVAVLLFCGTLFPALGFVNVYPMRFSFVADHFQYHASIGLIVLIAAGLARIAVKVAGRAGFAAICAIVLAPLGLLTWKQAHLYADALTLWRDTADKNPGSWMVWTNLGNTLVQRKQLDEAIPYYLRAVQLAPWERETHWNAGTAYMRLGDVNRAEDEYRESVRLDPAFPPGWASLGQLLYYRRHDVPGAMAAYRKALEIAPYYAEGNAMLAQALAAQGDIGGAIEHYRRALAVDPDDRDSHYNLGNLLLSQRQFAEAAYNFDEAVRIDPEYAEAWANLGAAQMQLGRREDAIRSLREALRINPTLIPPRRNLQLLGAG
jgi:tetratricopeptide (TPR) repeat protein